ncbi:hypothetical protein LEP1GSC132_2320 [Leptospira kirschneri str. 200803703]|nr:hypothetical protein LEP1GSC018_1418 [Leptospira kirschneri str. 2008720114]EMK19843.1 hypothetical protein LEP1GSC042_2937 [Leptospira kirschneri serovar Bim str. PUO 1247]EMN06448.1 hypothetical protein LEP1GSC046_1144 [Leptospira kirschneri serovar Bim str. 1051]EMN27556.1 hypothetical protein LEP1GSC065_0158 [Leptospira kirschneri serovar Sokoine str. RM1]EMO65772.1 hypothetical protein LEP1GSC132_2320 [Leptospira kirschneri str. 200803703]EPG49213.1 hypothetical protein LEP1GSC049_1548
MISFAGQFLSMIVDFDTILFSRLNESCKELYFLNWIECSKEYCDFFENHLTFEIYE